MNESVKIEIEKVEDIQKKVFGQPVYENLLKINDLKEGLDDVFDKIAYFVNHYVTVITPSQLRNIYGKIVDVQEPNKLKLLRPNMVYVAARTTGRDSKTAKIVIMFLEQLMKKVHDDQSLESFKKVMEAIVAYHKFYYSKNNNR